MKTFTCTDGRVLRVVEGFREQVLSYRPSVTPKPDWSEADYAAAAAKKQRRLKRLVESFLRFVGTLDGARVLDVGCGDGANCFLISRHEQVKLAVGIDLELPLFASGEKGQQTRRLIDRLLAGGNSLPVDLLQMDGTRMGFGAASFHVVMSRSAMEHIKPVERVLHEMARVVRPGGLIYLGIDPFFWLLGCHKRGVVDIPWAHARLGLDEYERFVTECEGREIAAERRRRLETLNRLTVRDWKQMIKSMPWEVLDWKEEPSEISQKILEQFPDVRDTLLPGVERADLLTERIKAWLRKR